MKSNKQRRAEIKHKRMTSRQDLEEQLRLATTPEARRALIDKARRKRLGVALADRAVLATHNNASFYPEYYVDKPFICDRCGASEVWTAEQQKWWYEVAHGSIYSGANTCRKCRQVQRAQVANDPMHVQAEQLRALGAHKPTPAANAAVQAALKSKWEGMQVIAIDVLGAWWGLTGDDAELEQLKAIATAPPPAGQHPYRGDAARYAARRAIARHLREADMGWALPWFLTHAHHRLHMLVPLMPQQALIDALSAPPWRAAWHDDAAQAESLLDLLVYTDARTPGWIALAEHAIASPLIGKRARTWLGWRIERQRQFL